MAVTCTSDTAAANLHPAVVEAWEARVPLIVLSADRHESGVVARFAQRGPQREPSAERVADQHAPLPLLGDLPKPAERSSITDTASMPGAAASVSAIGALREPGDVTAWRMPQRRSSSTRTWSGA